ncbi:MAG TPA: alpha/beta hydrolase [Steroidobacteraceae bacterium]|jgi:2-hydroxy-6-oxonona-2,4-dienedioate hydrolase|nr:alpha/beta hydrolase [Steroidobacteraceae bacterium]
MRKLRKIVGWTFGIVVTFIVAILAYANYRVTKDEVNAFDAEAPGRYFTVQGHRLHVRTFGDPALDPTGAPLMLVHGFLLSGHTSFLPWARDELAPKRSLILPDILGYGFSERIPTPGEHYTLKSYARDLAGILDSLGIEKVDLSGHSWGGVLAAQFAHDYPNRVRRLVIVDGAFFFPEPTIVEKIVQLPLGIGRGFAWEMLAGGPASYSSLICRRQPECEGAPTLRIKDSTETMRAMMYTSRHSGGMKELDAELAQITTPTLVLWGEKDPVVPVETGKRLARELPSARLVVVKDALHAPWFQEPKETARQLLDYLATP